MKKLIRNFAIAMLAVLLCTSFAYAQPPHKAKERICQAKKMRLLGLLNLDEATGDKFMVKYTFYDRKIEDIRHAMDGITKDIRKGAEENPSGTDFKSLAAKYNAAQKDLFQNIRERNEAMESILSAEQYAKFLAFENDFAKDLQKLLLKKRKQGRD